MDPQTDARPLMRREAAAWLTARGCRISPAILATLATKGGGPAYRRWGGGVRYLPDDLATWAASRWRDPAPRTQGEAA